VGLHVCDESVFRLLCLWNAWTYFNDTSQNYSLLGPHENDVIALEVGSGGEVHTGGLHGVLVMLHCGHISTPCYRGMKEIEHDAAVLADHIMQTVAVSNISNKCTIHIL